MKTNTRKGITLMRLLVIVLIIAALAAIAIPRIASNSSEAEDVETTAVEIGIDAAGQTVPETTTEDPGATETR